MKIVLAINAGSSSVKISVYRAESKHASLVKLAEAQVSGLTTSSSSSSPAKLTYDRGDTSVHKDQPVAADVKTQIRAFDLVLSTLVDDASLGEVSSRDDVGIACHRVVHGGDFAAPQLITEDTYHRLESLSGLAPLHNGPALAIVDACMKQLPRAVNVACFDSQFHATLPPHVYTYPIDPTVARRHHLRKYGFHGISYSFIVRSTASYLGIPSPSDLNVIALHLGSGASACAVRRGQSIDTSMGLTPLSGLPGATRSGSVDPSLVFHYASNNSGGGGDDDDNVGRMSPSSTAHLHITRAEEILNKQAGWAALTGTTDFGQITASAAEHNEKHRLAFDIFVDRVCAHVGSYYVALDGQVDALVFAGGIGEKSARLRAAVVDKVACLGFVVDAAKNEGGAGPERGQTVWDIGAAESKHRVLVCKTDEQYEIARESITRDDVW